jgi:hypothetical protein
LRGRWLYMLTYPNHEVKSSLNECLLGEYGVESIALRNRMNLIKILKIIRCMNWKRYFMPFLPAFRINSMTRIKA